MKGELDNNQTIIELHSITKRYGVGDAESYALRDFDLTVKRGEFIMIMGPSGCGKTTLLNIIGLLDKPTSGSYILNDTPVSRLSSRRQAHVRSKRIGFIFQNFNLIQDLPVIENVALPLTYSGATKTHRLTRASDTLERFHLQEKEYYMPYQLSGGQQQRVAIARSLVSKPEIILADEPTGNLDSRSSRVVMEELRHIHSEGNTIIMVTHNPNLTSYATRVINMLDGAIDTDIKTVADADLPQPVHVRVDKTPLAETNSSTPTTHQPSSSLSTASAATQSTTSISAAPTPKSSISTSSSSVSTHSASKSSVSPNPASTSDSPTSELSTPDSPDPESPSSESSSLTSTPAKAPSHPLLTKPKKKRKKGSR